MRLNKLSNYSSFRISKSEDYIKFVDTDLVNLFLFTQGRVRFGAVTDDTFSENISGEIHTFTSLATTNADFAVTHSLGVTPVGWIVLKQNKRGTLFTGTTSNSSTTAYFQSDATSTNFSVILLK